MDAINKAFEILDVFFETENDLSITELAKITKISTSTSHRIASILVDRGYIEQNQKRGKYFLSNQKLVFLSKVVRKRLKIRNIALPFIKELSQIVNEATLMSLRRGQMVYVVDFVNPDRLLNITPDSSTYNLYSTGIGKVFLSSMSEKDLDEYLSGILLKPRTPNTISDINELKRQLKIIAREGIAYEYEEHEMGLSMIAAPVFDWDQNVAAAIGVLGPSARISRERMAEISPVLKQYAQKISDALGYVKSPTIDQNNNNQVLI
jgi:IclR family transcriptional regulator, KDG regulon repressor